MHYRNGREAKNGDRIVQLSYEGGRVTSMGTLKDAQPGNDYCNGTLDPSGVIACLCDCLHEDDIAAILAEKGLDKRPAAK